MKCPYCGSEMADGVVQSAREIFFTTQPRKGWNFLNLKQEIHHLAGII